MGLDFITIYNALDFLTESIRLQYTNFIFRHKNRLNEDFTFEMAVNRLHNEEPIEYVFNVAEFCGLELYVDPRCLIPRVETEEIVTRTLDLITSSEQKNYTVLDIGTGSGCIALSLRTKIPDNSVKILGIEKSRDALVVAQRNRDLLNIDVTFVHADFRDFDFTKYENIIICSNLPYIPESDVLQKSVIDFEPHEALFGGIKGDELNNQLLAQIEDLPNIKAVFMEGYNGEITSIIRS
jgi:release factor glutamine methyltransferase